MAKRYIAIVVILLLNLFSPANSSAGKNVYLVDDFGLEHFHKGSLIT